MNEFDSSILSAAEQLDPNSPVVKVVEAAVTSAIDPSSPANILADLELAISLIKEFKAKMAGLHPSVINIVKLLF